MRYQSPPPLKRPADSGREETDLAMEDSFVRSPRFELSIGKVVFAGLSLLGLGSGVAPKAPATQVEAKTHLNSYSSLSAVDLKKSSVEYKVASSEQIQEATDWALDRSYASTPSRPGESRHELRERVQAKNLMDDETSETNKVHYNGADVVVIAFEGTGSFHPRRAPVIQAAAARLAEENLRVDGSQGALSGKVSGAIESREGRDPGWSGLSRGPLEEMIRDPELSQNVQWLSFPSEELEVLSGLDAIQSFDLRETLRESRNSYHGETPGVDGALKSVREVLIQAEKQGKNPKFMLVSHSSGGRSMVKFLEQAKSITNEQGEPLKFSSALTIDPVREAHEALIEGTGQYINKGTEHNLNRVRNLVGLPERRVWPPVVRHRPQPESLYAPSNVDKFSNFYQRRDTEGLKVGPKVGIHGSPIEGAHNQEITDVGTAGHGEIALHKTVLQAFRQSLRELIAPEG